MLLISVLGVVPRVRLGLKGQPPSRAGGVCISL